MPANLSTQPVPSKLAWVQGLLNAALETSALILQAASMDGRRASASQTLETRQVDPPPTHISF